MRNRFHFDVNLGDLAIENNFLSVFSNRLGSSSIDCKLEKRATVLKVTLLHGCFQVIQIVQILPNAQRISNKSERGIII